MDNRIKEMLLRAEEVRINLQNQSMHKEILREIIELALRKNLFTGDILKGTANENNLAFGTEWAAGVLEFSYGKYIGSVINLPPEKKITINKEAVKTMGRGEEFNI